MRAKPWMKLFILKNIRFSIFELPRALFFKTGNIRGQKISRTIVKLTPGFFFINFDRPSNPGYYGLALVKNV